MKKLRLLVMLALSVVMLTQCEGGIGGDIGSDSGNNGGNTEEPIEPNEPEEPENPTYNGHEYVDLGLPSGLLWATCNVGADKPEEYGDYFAWGETEPKDSYDVNNSVTYGKNIDELRSAGIIDSDNHLTPEYDAATVNWGGIWRMPTVDEMMELSDECDWQWTIQNGVNGQRVTGPNGNSIFLPAGTSLYDAGESGRYWSSAPNESSTNYACGLVFNSWARDLYYDYRSDGFTVRPVSE